jgi:radical SAM protein with 4Fe4S-binding SPASM domain
MATMALRNGYDFLIQWHLTERCNLRCRHCYQTAHGSFELSLDEIRTSLEEIGEMFDAWSEAYDVRFSPSFNITGGEPLLREDLFEVLSELRRRQYEIFLLTNGTLIDRERARLLSDLGMKGVQVSIEGCEEVHDSMRGEGSFCRAVDGIGHLLDAGVPVTLNVTLSRLNAASMRKVVLFASHLGVRRVGFSRLVPAGRGLGLASEMLQPQDMRQLYETLFSLDSMNLEVVTGDPVASQFRAGLRGEGETRARDGAPSGGCSAGVAGITIQADGTLVPCRRLPIPLGNIRTDSLREVWAASPVLDALRDKGRYGGACGTCERWEQCRGCRAIAYAYARSQGRDDFLAGDPQCFLADEQRGRRSVTRSSKRSADQRRNIRTTLRTSSGHVLRRGEA